MGSISSPLPHLTYPAPLPPADQPLHLTHPSVPITIETPVLIVGGGPVGMLLSLFLSRVHGVSSLLIERALSTTTFPKMEYTNGRSVELYNMLGLGDEFRKITAEVVPESARLDEIIATGFGEEGKLVGMWEREGREGMRKQSREGKNEGADYRDGHVRCHQIVVERWLREKVEGEEKVRGWWGCQFLGLEEQDEGGVVVEVLRERDAEVVKVKAQYVVGCDGGGSWVRRSVGLESKRELLNLATAFVHFTSKSLRETVSRFPRFWHGMVIGGGVLVSQNEDDLWTCHLVLPPGVDGANMTDEEIVGTTIGGCHGPEPVKFDEIHCRGVWTASVAVATRFRSEKGRVFLAGDAAHQLSPVGGHGLNSGMADVCDLAWKLAAVVKGWGGEKLLDSYDHERRQIALKNLATVQQALVECVAPILQEPLMKYGPEMMASAGEDGEKVRQEMQPTIKKGHWLHNQNGNILGYQYFDSSVVVTENETAERKISDKEIYLPTTWPGSRAPHVWMKGGESTLDPFSANSFNLVSFGGNKEEIDAFEKAAKEANVPLKVLEWAGEENVRKVYERDLVLIRPDGHVAWRSGEDGAVLPAVEVSKILRIASGR